MIMLFSERPEVVQRPYTFIVSIVVHCAAAALVAFGIIASPKVNTAAASERYDLRHLELHTIESEMQRARNEIEYPRSHFIKHTPPPGDNSAAMQPLMHQIVKAPPGPQTLVQPDIPKPVALTQEIPVPTVVIWDGKRSPAKTLVPPLPAKPAIAEVHPSLQLPNEEQKLADIAIASTNLPVQTPVVLPSTTSPVVVSGPKPSPPAPVTTAQGAAQPTPTAVMSLSDSHMANGDVMLPPVNESASSNSPGGLTPGQANGSAQTGRSNASGKAGGAGPAAGDPGDPAGQQAPSGSGQGFQMTAAHIARPITGQFGAVVVGSSIQDEFPDAPPLWNERLSYTVYLPVGLAKSWILQYSLPRDAEAAAAGKIAHIEAPWPYNIVRPNITPGAINADALMVHGFVNQAGRFESLAIAFPPQFSQAQFVLSSLAQWQFRPATQNGKNVKVEVLLIIPEEPE